MAKKTTYEDGPKSLRWIDRAEWLYLVAQRRKVAEEEAFKAWSHFIEAQDHRRNYNRSKSPSCESLHYAAREHRKGRQAYQVARDLLFPK